MAYTKTDWKTGDLITADKLNNAEAGIAANEAAIGEIPAGVQGPAGDAGKSAYQTWLDAGNTGDEAAFLLALKGAKGDKGDTGAAGKDGADGAVGPKGDPGAKGDPGDAGAKGEPGAAGVGVKSIAFVTDKDGKVTGATVTGTDGKPITATVTEAPAEG